MDASEKDGEAVGLGDDRSDTQGGRERFAEYVAEHRIDDDGDERQPGAKQGGSFDAVHMWHGKIEDDEVGLKGGCFIDGFDTVGGFAAHFKWGVVLQKNAHRVAD